MARFLSLWMELLYKQVGGKNKTKKTPKLVVDILLEGCCYNGNDKGNLEKTAVSDIILRLLQITTKTALQCTLHIKQGTPICKLNPHYKGIV